MSKKRVPQYIPGYGKSYALLSKEKTVDTAVIFVHGFGGKPTSTWRNFQGMVDEYSTDYSWWSGSDLFFYAYDSLHTPILYNAELLGNFVDLVWRNRWQGTNSPNGNLKYKDLIFAGHSEGGVIVRRLILDRYEEIEGKVKEANPKASVEALRSSLTSALTSDFVLASYLRLFAPACLGTNFSSWAALLSLPFVVSIVAASSLVKGELLPESPILNDLKRDTEQAHAAFPELRSLFIQPLFGVPDQIVYSKSYQKERIVWDPGYDHFAVCKPNYTHKRPLEFVCK